MGSSFNYVFGLKESIENKR